MMRIMFGFIFSLSTSMVNADLQNIDGTLDPVVWAHYTPWHNPLDTGFEVVSYYNYPIMSSSGNQTNDYRKEYEMAQEQGIDGFLVDIVGSDGTETAAYSGLLKLMFEAAEGTDFLIAPCLDGTPDVTSQITQLTNLLNECSGYSNFPKVGNRYVIATYEWYGHSSGEWTQIRSAVESAGYPLYLIANMERGYDPITSDLYDTYGDAYDMTYIFSHASLAGEDETTVFQRMQSCSESNNAAWMGTVWPGYLGAWMNGRNDFYQPHFGFDQVLYYFDAIFTLNPPWINLSTWNGHDETPFMPMSFEFGGNTVVNRYLLDRWKGYALPTESQVCFAYHREEIIGAVLRIESLVLPGEGGNSITVSGKLLGIDDEELCSLSEQVFDLTGSNVYFRNEWVVPTAELGAVPAVVPEITLVENGVSRTEKLPAVMLKTGWIQNQTTVKVPFDRMVDGDAVLSVDQDGNLLMADVFFSCSENVVRAELFRNDRPVGPLTEQLTANPLLFSQFEMVSDSGSVQATVSNGILISAARRYTESNSTAFSFTTNSFNALGVLSWRWVRMQMEMSPYGGLGLNVGSLGSYAVDVLQLQDQHTVYSVDKSSMLLMNDFDNNVNDHPLLTPSQTASLSLDVWSREELENDTFYAQFETESGGLFFSPVIAPFCEQRKPVARKALQTMDNLETSSGNKVLGRTGYLNTPPFLTPEVTNIFVHPASLRSGQWTFEEGSWDSLGERPIWTAKQHEWMDATNYITGGGYDGGNCLDLNGQSGVEMRARVWPMGPCAVEFFIKPVEDQSAIQEIITREGSYSSFNFYLLPDRRLEVVREEDDDTMSLVSREPLPLGLWSQVRFAYDGERAELFVDGNISDYLDTPFEINYDNCTVVLGSGGFAGMMDDLTVWSYAHPDFVDCFDRADTALTTNGGMLGVGYLIADTGSASFQVTDQQIAVGSTGGYENSLLVYTNRGVENGLGCSFRASIDVIYQSLSPTFSGLVLNYQDDLNYYAVQFRAYSSAGSYLQLRKMVDGVESSIATVYLPQLTNNVQYTLEVTSGVAGAFGISLAGGATHVNYQWADPDAEFLDGYAGIYMDRAVQCGAVRFDNFSIEQHGIDLVDNFEREDTGLVSDGSIIGREYMIPDTGDPSFQIIGGVLSAGASGGYEDSLLVFTNHATLNDAGRAFQSSVDITYDSLSPTLSGLVLNYIDQTNYYAIRLTPGASAGTGYVQLFQVVNGVEASVAVNYLSSLTSGVTYCLTVSSDTEGVFDYSIVGGAFSHSGTFTDPIVDFSGGYSGIYLDRSKQTMVISFDNLSIANQ